MSPRLLQLSNLSFSHSAVRRGMSATVCAGAAGRPDAASESMDAARQRHIAAIRDSNRVLEESERTFTSSSPLGRRSFCESFFCGGFFWAIVGAVFVVFLFFVFCFIVELFVESGFRVVIGRHFFRLVFQLAAPVELADDVGMVAPIGAHLYEQIQEHLAPENLFSSSRA